MKINESKIFIAIFILFTVVLISQIYFRPIDRDEGFWIGSAQLFNHGYRLYLDFTLPHTPLVNIIYSILFKIVGIGIIIGRYFNALLGLISFILIYYTTRKENLPSKIIPLIIFTFSYLTINWLIPIKVYSITLLLIILSFTFLTLSLKDNSQKWSIFITGVLLGLTISSRIVLVPLLLVPLFYIRKMQRPIKGVFLYIIGVIIGLIPTIYYVIKCPGYFYFNVVGLHTSVLNGYKSQLIRLNLFKELLIDPNSIIIFLITILAIYYLLSKKTVPIETISTTFLIIIIIVSIIPISTSLQYFTLTIPFVSISSSFIFERLSKSKKFKNILYILIIIYILLGLTRPTYRLMFDYYHKPLVGINEVINVENYIKNNVSEKDIVATWWSGYITKGIPQPDLLLGAFSERTANLISEEDRKIYHLPSYNEQIEIILRERPAWVVVGIDSPEEIEKIIRERYTLIKIIGETRIYAIND